MDEATIARLNAINRDFYAITAASFSRTRRSPWPGWSHLLPFLTDTPRLTVLDAGCGNGRFGLFLAQNHRNTIQYTGLDNNAALLAEAHSALEAETEVDVRLIQHDIIQQPLPHNDTYALVVLFGMLHHIPGASRRKALLLSLAGRVAAGGVLAFTAWRFYDDERLRSRILPWPTELAPHVEHHDYLLDWRAGDIPAPDGQPALRYCHHVDDAEFNALAEALLAEDLAQAAVYDADGASGRLNRYGIFRRPTT